MSDPHQLSKTAEDTVFYCCPACRLSSAFAESTPKCSRCGALAQRLDSNFIDFIGEDTELARTILNWPDQDFRAVEEAAVIAWRGDVLSVEQRTLLDKLGLLETTGELNNIGRVAGYNSSEFVWQSNYDPLEDLVEAPQLSPETAVLDIGGGSGQTVRRLFDKITGKVYVVDVSADKLAYGARLFKHYQMPAEFCCASVHSLPFADRSFDFVICRGVISYTIQRQALAEIVRVMRPNALLFLRVETMLWDIRALRHSSRLLNFLFAVRSFAVGGLHDLTGYQPTPGRSWVFGPRAYVSRRRLTKTLKHLNCDIVSAKMSARGPQIAGRGTQDVILVRKNEKNSNAA